MLRTLTIGNKEVTLSNNISWTMIYRDQFGHDIVSTLTPMLAAVMDMVSGFVNSISSDNGKVDSIEVLRNLDGDKIIDAIAHLSGLELVDLINITWAMAKAVDDSIPEPRRWVRDFDTFPIDEIAVEVAKLAVLGMVSTKNLKRLNNLIESLKKVQPLTLTPSSSQESSGD